MAEENLVESMATRKRQKVTPLKISTTVILAPAIHLGRGAPRAGQATGRSQTSGRRGGRG